MAILALLAAGGGIFAATPFAGFAGDNWPGYAIQDGQVDLAKTDSKIVPGGRLVLYDPPRARGYEIAQTTTAFRQDFLLSAAVTRLSVTPDNDLAAFDLPTTQAWVESSELELAVASAEVPTAVSGGTIELAGQLTTELPEGQKLLLTGQPLNAVLLPAGGVLQRQGESWRALGPRGTAVAALAVRGAEVWAATGAGVFQLAAGDLVPRNGGLAAGRASTLAVGPGEEIFAGACAGAGGGGGGGVFRWHAAGQAWQPWGLAGEPVTALAAGGTGSLYAATSAGKLFEGPAGGAAEDWQPLPVLAAAVLTLAVHPESGRLCAGTGDGVWHLEGAAWQRSGAALAAAAVPALLWSAGQLYAGTLGSGVFRQQAGDWQSLGSGPGNGRVTALAASPPGLAAGLAGGAGVWLWDGAGWQAAVTGVSNSIQALAAAGGELFAGAGNVSVLESPANLQALAVGTDPLFVYAPAAVDLASLDQGNLPASLVEAFSVNAAPLSPQAVVAPRAPGEFWVLEDAGDAVTYLWRLSAAAVQVAAAGAVMQVTARPRPAAASPAGAEDWPLADQLGVAGSLTALPGEVLLLPARPTDPAASEVARLRAQLPIAGTAAAPAPTVGADDRRRTVLVLEHDLAGCYDAATVSLSANVAHATHGQSVQEVLGSGDASKPNQGFRTRRSPVVHLAGPDGPRSTLAVQVDGVTWREVPSLALASPGSRVYAVTYDADGHAGITFGDGEHGAALPSGRDNVVAFYRGGSRGSEAEVGAGRLVQLLAPAGRVQRVANPQPATRAQRVAGPVGAAPPPPIRTLRRAVTA
ncbi:MAG TPA: hypothetical protein VN999_19400, partial [Thermoanaerobaculia bacterium]|nr:hypothetical protein [Thermoanaerobaculia bacterium]